MTIEPGLTRRAEPARHGATGLAAYADSGPVGIEHEDRLDLVAVVGLPQPLERLPLVGLLDLDLGERQGSGFVQMGAQLLGDRCDLIGVAQVRVEPLPDLVDAVTRLTVAEFCEFVSIEVVEGGAGSAQLVDASIVRRYARSVR